MSDAAGSAAATGSASVTGFQAVATALHHRDTTGFAGQGRGAEAARAGGRAEATVYVLMARKLSIWLRTIIWD